MFNFRTRVAVCCGWLLLLGLVISVDAADHLDAPLVLADGRLDINDLYLFQSPENSDNVVMIMTVNPVAGLMSPTTFHPQGKYELNIDTNFDALADITYRFSFGAPNKTGQQRILLQRNGAVVARGLTGTETRLRTRLGGRFRADVFDDPFFFDLVGFQNGFQFTGDDFFAGLNVSAIVLEVPRADLGDTVSGPVVGVWARTLVQKKTISGLIQFDRIGRPAINTVLIPSDLKDAFNLGQPVDDFDDFGDVVITTLLTLNNDPVLSQQLAEVLLPDILTGDTSVSAGFLNGRRLEDDVIDAELNLLSGGGVVTDGVDANDVLFLQSFPYLAAPHDGG